MDVSLLVLTKENREECAGLGVGEDQQGFVNPNLFCIAKARVEPGWGPLAVYRGATMVVPGVRIAGTCVVSTL